MASSSSSSQRQPPEEMLPLIPCPFCKDELLTFVCGPSGSRPGKRFYNCIWKDAGKCKFYEWQEGYARYLAADPAPHVVQDQTQSVVRADPSPGAEQHSAAILGVVKDLLRLNLLVAATNLMATALLQDPGQFMPDSDSCDDFSELHGRQHRSTAAKPSSRRLTASSGRTDAIPPNCTSRSSVRHAVSVIRSFSEYKRWLVEEIGFGGLLELPMIQKLKLKLSSWTMSKVDLIRRAIVITDKKVLPFTPSDVAKVYGIPCGNRDARGPDGNINKESITFIKKTLGMDHSAAHSLSAAEDFLNRNITQESSKLEKDCFQIAFVIFAMGHVLAPSSKHDYKSIDFWGVLASTEEIAQFNWCEYVLQCLLNAVSKLKIVTTANLTGCHLFLQVFLLDNLDLGIFNMKHDVLPRVKQFDQESLRRMTTMANDVGVPEPSLSSSTLRDASTVCYSKERTS